MNNSVPILAKAGTGSLRAGDRVSDEASVQMLDKAAADCVDTCFSRLDGQRNQCTFGKNGVCCRLCYMGPCRITPKALRGVCGADADTIVARNYVREVAGGTAAHSDHGRHLVLLLKKVAEGRGGSYRIADEPALRRSARLYEIEEAGRTKEAVALDLADLFISEFNRQEDPLWTLRLAPVKRQVKAGRIRMMRGPEMFRPLEQFLAGPVMRVCRELQGRLNVVFPGLETLPDRRRESSPEIFYGRRAFVFCEMFLREFEQPRVGIF